MSEWFDKRKQISGNFSKLLQERIEKANPRSELTADETKRLAKLEAIAEKLKRGENVQNRQPRSFPPASLGRFVVFRALLPQTRQTSTDERRS